MSYKSILKKGAFLVAASIISLAACKRSDNAPVLTSNDDNGGYASDGAKMEQTNNDVISIADVAGSTSSGSNLRTAETTLGGCATVTNNTGVTPHVLTIDFGTSDCICLDLRPRRGKIIVTYSGNYRDSGSTHTISYSNYFVNDMQVAGSKTVTNMGTNTSGQVWYNVTVNDSLIQAGDSVITWVGSRTRTWLAGYSTSTDRSDDVYAIGGSTTLTRANGHVFTYTISPASPLKVALNCLWIESGIVTVSSSTFAGGDRTLDFSYGTGGCDAKALLTIGSHSYVITMW